MCDWTTRWPGKARAVNTPRLEHSPIGGCFLCACVMRLSSGIIAGMATRFPPLPIGRVHKYGARRTVVDGINFHSKKEALRYGELKLLERAGEINALERQPRFTFCINSVIMFTYVADFRYRDVRADAWVVEDVKGVKTALYKLKKKIVEADRGITIVET